MRLNLICSEKNRKTLQELLNSRGVALDSARPVHLVEKGFNAPNDGLVINFDPCRLDLLCAFFDEMSEEIPGGQEKEFIVAKRGEGFEVLQTEEIFYFFADGNFIYCQTRSGRLEVRKKLYVLEKELTEKGFVRVNKANLINILAIREIIPWFSGRLLLKLKDELGEIEVSRNYVRSFKEFLGM